jgi:hypothetical protein
MKGMKGKGGLLILLNVKERKRQVTFSLSYDDENFFSGDTFLCDGTAGVFLSLVGA